MFTKGIYQRLSPKLHFNAANFQAYVKAKEGTNFILLHFVRALSPTIYTGKNANSYQVVPHGDRSFAPTHSSQLLWRHHATPLPE
jgi:hypothetical protein